MANSRAFMLQKLSDRDPEYDGHFLAERSDKRRYCLPSCSIERVALASLRLFSNEAEALAAGLRPCSDCRPHVFYKSYDPEEGLAIQLVTQLNQDLARIGPRSDLVARFELNDPKICRVLRRFYQQTPAVMIDKLRAAQAASRLASGETDLLRLASLLGYSDMADVERLFVAYLGLHPDVYLDLPSVSAYRIHLPTGFRSDLLIPYWCRDANNLILQREGAWFWRSFQVGETSCLVRGRFEQGFFYVILEVAPPELDRFALHDQILRILGIPFNPAPFENGMRKMGRENLINVNVGLRVTLTPTVFESLVWTIIGQQINLAFAYRLRNRLIRIAGEEVGQDRFAHPIAKAVANLSIDELLEHQFSRRKAEYLIGVSKRIDQGHLPVEQWRTKPVTLVERRLQAERGIGRWTARYVAMRAYGFSDCVPVGDAGLRRALRKYFELSSPPDAVATENLMAIFSPYQSLATFHLWHGWT